MFACVALQGIYNLTEEEEGGRKIFHFNNNYSERGMSVLQEPGGRVRQGGVPSPGRKDAIGEEGVSVWGLRL